jgi:hypothetical protein
MKPLVLYCHSYRQDALRARRLAESVARYNRERLDFYVSAAREDLPLFRETFGSIPCQFIAKEDILATNPRLDLAKIAAMPGYRSQQVVKSEFWRLGLCQTYVCLDSDNFFIRDFTSADFLAPDGTPYTVCHEGKSLLQYLVNIGKDKYVDHADEEHRRFQEQFPGIAVHYRFGHSPFIWSRQVWEALDEKMLKPRNMSFADAIELFPSEMHWYGGAMLTYRPFPLLPREPLFRTYSYQEEYWRARRLGENEETLRRLNLGMVVQSAWDKSGDIDREKVLRRSLRKALKYLFGRW